MSFISCDRCVLRAIFVWMQLPASVGPAVMIHTVVSSSPRLQKMFHDSGLQILRTHGFLLRNPWNQKKTFLAAFDPQESCSAASFSGTSFKTNCCLLGMSCKSFFGDLSFIFGCVVCIFIFYPHNNGMIPNWPTDLCSACHRLVCVSTAGWSVPCNILPPLHHCINKYINKHTHIYIYMYIS